MLYKTITYLESVFMNGATEFQKPIFRHFRKAPESIMKRIMVRATDKEERKIRFEKRLLASMNTGS